MTEWRDLSEPNISYAVRKPNLFQYDFVIKTEEHQDEISKLEYKFDLDGYEIKSEKSSDSSDIDLEPEPLVYEVQKKKKKKDLDMQLRDPLKEEVDDEESNNNHDSDNALGTFQTQDHKSEDKAHEDKDLNIEGTIDTAECLYNCSCKICSTMFKDATALKHHMRKQHKHFGDSYKLKCDFCEEMFKKELSLQEHVKKTHENKNCKLKSEFGNLACGHCPLVFSNFDTLIVHRHRKHSIYEKSFLHKCSECDLSYDKIDSLKKHMKRKHHTSKQMTNETKLNFYECKICGMIYETQSSLTRHMGTAHKLHTPADVKYFCQVCGDGFIAKRPLQTHVERIHSKINYTCTTCGAQFKVLDSFRKHLNRKHLANRHAYLCSYCANTFNTELRLSEHISYVHSTNSEDNSSKTVSDVLEKADSTTLVNRPVADFEDRQKTAEKHSKVLDCKRCSYKAYHWKALARHVKRIHLHVKLKTCPQKTTCQFCGLILNRTGLAKHIRLKHTREENDNKCKSCNFVSQDKCAFKEHLRTHF